LILLRRRGGGFARARDSAALRAARDRFTQLSYPFGARQLASGNAEADFIEYSSTISHVVARCRANNPNRRSLSAPRASRDSISALKGRDLTSRVIARYDVPRDDYAPDTSREREDCIEAKDVVSSSTSLVKVSYVCERRLRKRTASPRLPLLFAASDSSKGPSIACVIEHMLATVRPPPCVPYVRVYSQLVRCEHTRCACVTHRVNIWYK